MSNWDAQALYWASKCLVYAQIQGSFTNEESRMCIWHIPFQSASEDFTYGMDNFKIFCWSDKIPLFTNIGFITCQLIYKDVTVISVPSITSTYGEKALLTI